MIEDCFYMLYDLFAVCAVYVDSHGRKCRPYEIMWPANPTSISKFLILYHNHLCHVVLMIINMTHIVINMTHIVINLTHIVINMTHRHKHDTYSYKHDTYSYKHDT